MTTLDELAREQLPEQFIPKHVEPGTVYVDESDETVPPGWYVLAEYEPGSGEGADIVIKIDYAYDHSGVDISGALARKIADLLDEFAQDEPAPKPRVFFDGDTVPAGVRVMNEDGDIYPDLDDIEEEWTNGLGPVVEVLTDYEAEVARARQEREGER